MKPFEKTACSRFAALEAVVGAVGSAAQKEQETAAVPKVEPEPAAVQNATPGSAPPLPAGRGAFRRKTAELSSE